jgi:hypothetical protein
VPARRRAFTRAELQAFFDAADDLVDTEFAKGSNVVAVEARRHAANTIPLVGGAGPDRHHGARDEAKVHRVVSLTQRRLTDPAAVIAGLPPDMRPLPSVAGYDELLAKRTTTNAVSAGPVSKENIS